MRLQMKMQGIPLGGWILGLFWISEIVLAAADAKAPTPMDMLEAVNKFRSGKGKKPLCWSPYEILILSLFR